MMRVAVVDDEPLARSGVIARLASCSDVMVDGEYADGPSALVGLEQRRPDLVFIDVQMPGMTGLEVLAALPPTCRPLAILLTAHDSFAVQAFALNAVDYLLKPVDELRFAEALERARRLLAWHAGGTAAQTPGGAVAEPAWPTRFSVRVGRRSLFVATADIDWIEADGDYVSLHADGRVYLLRESLHHLATRLDPACFVRIHRSTIVRVDRIAELQAQTNRDAMLRLHDGTPLRVSRTYIDTLLARLHGASS
ncbi:LytR/AlgR family response regulator transcription factor [Lysobacter antibioticus]|uniref:Response regulator n=1 Tax=Lysobacter antibioticus TaxID=84531 RepID=A0A0S2FB36_LYSAN|nr:LytTR family DNA-binding domain-containing protein [Lysobacter antibioticus]ALN80736.1 response regulator [Lysobacter antibioticus]